jgi:hypothetical protein
VGIIAEFARHFVRPLDAAGEDVDPIVFVDSQTVVMVTLGVHFRAVLVESAESYPYPLRPVLNS